MAYDYDIVVIGGGPAGLAFGRAMGGSGLKIAILEKTAQNVLADPSYDGREIALTHGSMDILGELDVRKHIPDTDISLIRHARVLNESSPYALHFDYQETDKDNLGFMVANATLRKALYSAAAQTDNLNIFSNHTVENTTRHDKGGYTVSLVNGQTLSTRMIIAADSRFSDTRRRLGISAEMLDFGRICIVCKMKITGDHEQTAFECFQSGRTMAVLPLNNQHASVVITVDAAEADNIMNMSATDFSTDITQRFNHKFGEMTLISKRFSYPLVATYARRFYAPESALIGDAAVGMHPVTAHGFNLGLKSAVTLAGLVTEAAVMGQDITAPALLTRYHHTHRRASRLLYLGTNTLVKLYTNTSPPARLMRRALLRLGNHLRPAKKLIRDQLTDSHKAS